MKKRFFSSALEIDLNTDRQLTRRSQQIMLVRLVLFLAVLLTAAAGYDQRQPALYVAAAALLLGFIALLRFHTQIREHQLLLQSHMAILYQYLARFNGEWHRFTTNGAEYLSEKQPQGLDLSIFGPDSIYQYICAARTKRGRDRLAASLTPKPKDFRLARQRQLGTAELINRQRLCSDLMAIAALLPEQHDTSNLLHQLENAKLPQSRFLHHTAWSLPCLGLIGLLLAASGRISWLLPGCIFALQLILSGLFAGRNSIALEPLAKFHQELRLYHTLFARLEASTFRSPYLQELQKRLQKGPGATRALQQLAHLSEYARMRYNLIFAFLANTLLLWDFHCASYFVAWKQEAAVHLREWIDIWSELEVLLSLAVIGQTRETYAFPTLLDQKEPLLEANALSHLLLPEETAIPNDTNAQSETRIITGSNMSGKTTYLRTLASSCVLAYAGAPVCAKTMRLSRLYLYTSIRVTDDVARGLSTFYAELLRIKSMIEFQKKGLPMFICIDEIFKGTNSADRIIGAREAIRHLTGPHNITMVSTHDFELCELQSPNDIPVTNYHFSEHYQEDKLLFDYKIKPGRCQTTNAKYLLKMAGIL